MERKEMFARWGYLSCGRLSDRLAKMTAISLNFSQINSAESTHHDKNPESTDRGFPCSSLVFIGRLTAQASILECTETSPNTLHRRLQHQTMFSHIAPVDSSSLHQSQDANVVDRNKRQGIQQT